MPLRTLTGHRWYKSAPIYMNIQRISENSRGLAHPGTPSQEVVDLMQTFIKVGYNRKMDYPFINN
jgi:hypothetical protein